MVHAMELGGLLGSQNETLLSLSFVQRIEIQASSIYGLHLPLCYALISLLGKWPSDMFKHHPSKLLVVAAENC